MTTFEIPDVAAGTWKIVDSGGTAAPVQVTVRESNDMAAVKQRAPRAHPDVDPMGYPLMFNLREADFTTSKRVAEAINGTRVTVNYSGWLYSTTAAENTMVWTMIPGSRNSR